MTFFKFDGCRKLSTGLVLVLLLLGLSSYSIYAQESEKDFQALNLIEEGQELRKNQKLDEALSKLSEAAKLTENKELGSLANLEIAYVKYLQGKHSIVYKMFIKKALDLNPSLEIQGYYDKEFKKEFDISKPGTKNVGEKEEQEIGGKEPEKKPAEVKEQKPLEKESDVKEGEAGEVEQKEDETLKKEEELEKEIEAAQKEVEKWDKILNDRKGRTVRSEKSDKEAEEKLKEAQEIVKSKEEALSIYKQEMLAAKKKKEEETRYVSAGDLKTYERKSLFVFPTIYKNYKKSANLGILTKKRKSFISRQMKKMFETDFERFNIIRIHAGASVTTFLQDADAYVKKYKKKITAGMMDMDGRFKDKMVKAEDLTKTIKNSYALVPVIDSIEKKEVEKKESTKYVYNMYIHFDVYDTNSKLKIKTLQSNNKKSILGVLSSVTGSLQVDDSDLKDLPESVREDEKSFRNAITGLFAIQKKKIKEMEEFRIYATVTDLSLLRFGFQMGEDVGIKIDHRYKTFVDVGDGSKKMTGFGKIRKVEKNSSKAQTLIGKPEEGDQVVEDPKVGINVVGGFGFAPFKANLYDNKIISGSHPCLILGAEYELGPLTGFSEWYAAIDLRIGLPGTEEKFKDTVSASQVLYNLGIIKKIYIRRWSLVFGGYFGVHSATLDGGYNWGKTKGSGYGVALRGGAEMLITPSISAFARLGLDLYPNASSVSIDGQKYIPLSDDFAWNAKGISLNFGAKVTL